MTFIIKRAETGKGVKLYREHADGGRTLLGSYRSFDQAETTARLLSGFRGKVRREA